MNPLHSILCFAALAIVWLVYWRLARTDSRTLRPGLIAAAIGLVAGLAFA